MFFTAIASSRIFLLFTVFSYFLTQCNAATTIPLTKHATDLSAVLKKIERSNGIPLRRRSVDPALGVELDGESSGGLTYTVDIQLNGGPNMSVIVDTGSNQFWVPSTTCPSCAAGGMMNSSLVAPEGCSEISLIYGIGTVNGCIESTTLHVGEYTVSDLDVLAVTHLDEDMQWQGEFMSGIWGMARDQSTPEGGPTAVSLMYQQGLIKSPTVGFYLARDDTSKSEMTIGDVTALPYTNTDRQVTLQSADNTYDLYHITLDSVEVNGKVLKHDRPVIIDTGSTSIATPEPLIDDIYSALFNDAAVKHTENQRYMVPCKPMRNATVSLTFGGLSFGMEAIDLVGPKVEDGYDWCYGRFIPAFEGLEHMVVGDAFLHNVYHTVNVQTGEVTFYDLA
ncbi:hypothetical protein IAT40_007721 [Kwoniella sp. CBS 6097]